MLLIVVERDLGAGEADADDSPARGGGGGGGAFFVFFSTETCGAGFSTLRVAYLRGTGGSKPTNGPPCFAM